LRQGPRVEFQLYTLYFLLFPFIYSNLPSFLLHRLLSSFYCVYLSFLRFNQHSPTMPSRVPFSLATVCQSPFYPFFPSPAFFLPFPGLSSQLGLLSHCRKYAFYRVSFYFINKSLCSVRPCRCVFPTSRKYKDENGSNFTPYSD